MDTTIDLKRRQLLRLKEEEKHSNLYSELKGSEF